MIIPRNKSHPVETTAPLEIKQLDDDVISSNTVVPETTVVNQAEVEAESDDDDL